MKNYDLQETVMNRIRDDLDHFRENMLLKKKESIYENAHLVDSYQTLAEYIFNNPQDIDFNLLDVKNPLKKMVEFFYNKGNFDHSQREISTIKQFLEHRREQSKQETNEM